MRAYAENDIWFPKVPCTPVGKRSRLNPSRVDGGSGAIEGAVRITGAIVRMLPGSKVLALWHRNLATRHALARLSAEYLEDIGLAETQRAAEIAKPFWR